MKTKIWISFIALIYIVLGVCFLVNPAGMGTGIGMTDISLEAQIELQAFYGMLEVSLGLYLIQLGFKNNIQEALRLIAFTFIAFALGRSIGCIQAGEFVGNHSLWLCIEVPVIIINFLITHKQKRV